MPGMGRNTILRLYNPLVLFFDKSWRPSADGCDEAVLLADGFTVGQLAGLVIDGFATGSVARVAVDGREKPVVWIKITEAGRRAIAEMNLGASLPALRVRGDRSASLAQLVGVIIVRAAGSRRAAARSRRARRSGPAFVLVEKVIATTASRPS
jgi:hypothetical protein